MLLPSLRLRFPPRQTLPSQGRTAGAGPTPRLVGVTSLRLFAQAREAAGEKVAQFEGSTVGEILDAAVAAFGSDFEAVLGGSKVWLNGTPTDRSDAVKDGDEVAVLPPVSGG